MSDRVLRQAEQAATKWLNGVMSGLRRRHVETADGVKLNVVEAGLVDGLPMVFVHGLASSLKAWDGVMAVPELTSHYRLIAFDLRGHGDSDTALVPEQLTADGPQASARLWSLDLDAVLSGLRSPVLVAGPSEAESSSHGSTRTAAQGTPKRSCSLAHPT